MIKVRGIYKGTHVRLLEPVDLAPDTLRAGAHPGSPPSQTIIEERR